MMYKEEKMTISQQENLIALSEKKKVPFSQLLKQNGFSYDDLQYVNNPNIDINCLRPIETLDDIEKSTDNIPAISFFPVQEGLMLVLAMLDLTTLFL